MGYSEDSYTAHDFNITPYLHTDGTPNTLAVKVFRWSDGSFLENQDFIRLSGIFRDVSIYSKANVELRDFFVHTTSVSYTHLDVYKRQPLCRSTIRTIIPK